jgi:exodeoxyribonuclease VII small subunit
MIPFMAAATSGGDAEPGFDGVLARLREVVERLEGGNLSLEESLRVYEDGVGLARRGHELLDRAEKRVELLVSSSGGISTVPLDLDQPTTGGTG